ncbi:hypothetical protein DTO271D3_5313 [Paecilomyces variotii]|nr:hypothetical protein DTO271D3_5313 [Paecilomyces variotii]KAJ9357633.1 hypothetical protein DTO027B9_2951 [Paecilomyces variotii]KAJ9362682.1 hypothetical protein DTO280E4_3335 [Paecilomyces variotii]KAJ9389898.1 hypothetical protein DTO063F5_1670 [Paecilomyces variotii]
MGTYINDTISYGTCVLQKQTSCHRTDRSLSAVSQQLLRGRHTAVAPSSTCSRLAGPELISHKIHDFQMPDPTVIS